MIYCLSPRCQERENLDELEYCHYCGTKLLISEQYRLVQPIHLHTPLRTTEVFVAQQEGKRKILKALLPQNQAQIDRFEREALILQIQDHPGIPHSYFDDYFEFSVGNDAITLHCLVMDFVEGQTLEEWLIENRRASQEQILDWLSQLADILKTVHGLDYIHSDIKPANIILRPDAKLSLIDFGLAAAIGEDRRDVIAGTAGYIAPEQADGMPVPQSDFYSLGRTLIRLATGAPLGTFAKDTRTGQLLWRNLAPQLDPPVVDLLDRLVAPGLAFRPPTAQAILDALEQVPSQIRRLKRYRIVRSPQFKMGLVMLGALSVFGVYRVSSLAAYWYYYLVGLQVQGSTLPGAAQVAREQFEKAVAISPEDADARLSLAEACQDSGDNYCAFQEYQKALEIQPDHAEAHYNLGGFFEQLNEFPLAEDEFKSAIEYGADQTGIVSNALSRLKNRTRKYEAAIPLAERALTKTDDPKAKAVTYKNLGWAEFGLKRYHKAQTNLQQSIQLDPDRPDAYCLLAQVQDVRGNKAGANQSWRNCLQRNNSLDLPEVSQWRDQVLNRLYKKVP